MITDVYYPQVASVSVLMAQLAQSLVTRGHKVSVLTYFPSNRLTVDDKNHSVGFYEIIQGVEIYRVRTYSTYGVGYIKRGINSILNSTKLYKAAKILFVGKSFDSILVYSPPLNICNTARKISKWKKCSYSIILRDIFPQNAIDLGILKNSLIIKYYNSLEKKVYSDAKFIFPQCKSNKELLIRNNKISRSKLKTIYNWSKIPSKSDFEKMNWKISETGHFICLYAGTIGPSQDLEFLLEVAKEIDDSEVVFLIVGDGEKKKYLVDRVSQEGLKNVIFKDYVLPEFFASLVYSSNIGIISLSKKNKTSIIPGKLSTYMAVGIPIIARINKESTDLINIIKETNAGRIVLEDDVKSFIEAIEYYKNWFHRKEAIENGQKFALKEFWVENIAQKIEAYI